MGAKGKIGLIGLAVMGANLARNLAGHGISTVVYNRSHDKTENFLKEFGSDTNLSGAAALEELVNSLEKPRKIILMIKAGEAVDAMIAKLIPLLEKDDILIEKPKYLDDNLLSMPPLAIEALSKELDRFRDLLITSVRGFVSYLHEE